MAHRRALRFALRLKDSRETRAVNCVRKGKERARRRARMLAVLRTGRGPYPLAVMSWLSREMDKPASKISAEDIRVFVA